MRLSTSIPHSPERNFASALLGNFEILDKNKDGVLQPEEIRDRLTDPSLELESAALVGTLLRRRAQAGQLSRVSNDQWGLEAGITRSDLKALPQHRLSERMEETFVLCHEAASQHSDQLFTGVSLANSVRQGGVEDCWLMAPLSSLTQHSSETIRQTIEALPDEGYEVNFPDGKSALVGPPTRAESAAFASSGTSGHWLEVLEKARGVCNQGFIKEKTEQFALMGGLRPTVKGIRETTGDSADQDWLFFTSKKTTREKMCSHLSSGDVVLAATGPGILPRLVGRGADLEGLVPGHVYTVTDYSAKADSVTLRNPWGDTEWHGSADGKDDGVFTMPMNDFHALFSEVAYQTSR